jgi:RNA polymerase sigma factor (sigma-70 family)
MILSKGGGSSPTTEATQYEQAQAGCQASLNWLMAQHEGLVHYAIKRQNLCGLGYEEALQAGRVGLWRAIMGYDPQRGTRFSTYAYLAIIRQVWAEVRGHLVSQRRQVPRAVLGLYLYEPGLDPAGLREWGDVCQSLLALVDRLPLPQAEVIRRHYGLAGQAVQTQAEIGLQMGVSKQRVSQVECAALSWLRQPAHSQVLRSLLGRHNQAQYELADRLAQVWLQRRGGRHGRG